MFSVATLNINIAANGDPARAALQSVSTQAQTSMAESQRAVEDFRTQFDASAASMQQASQQMGGAMDRAKTAIVASSQQSEQALKHLADAAQEISVNNTFAEKMAASFGAAFGAGYAAAKTWIERTEEYVATKAKYIAIGLAVAAVSATAGVVYGAYHLISGTLGFITGLFTGDSYKSASIDALIALNKQVLDLQVNLNLDAEAAHALLDATQRLGVGTPDLVSAYSAAQKAMRSNGDELDRLGIHYKDTNGSLLQTREFLGNARSKLDEYSAGFDRNAAAAAIGVGSYQQIVQVLKVTDAQIAASADRLADYQVAIGPTTQAAVARYQQAMLTFNHETALMGEGFKRVIADNIMPALTDLAEFFAEGFPFAVRAFRGSLATVTSMLYGLKTVADLIYDTFKGATLAVGELLVGLANAGAQALTGNFSGAADAFKNGWSRAGVAVHATFDEMVSDAARNRDRMIMAWGFADLVGGQPKNNPQGPLGNKAWEPPPKPPTESAAAATSAYATYLDTLDRTVKKLQENEYASMRLHAAQLAQKEAITDLSGAYSRINAIQRGESQNAVNEMTRKLGEENIAFAFQTSLLGHTALQQDKLNFANQKWLEVSNMVAAAKRAGKPLDDQAIADLATQTEATIKLGNDQRDQRDSLTRSAAYGTDKAVQDYLDGATNAADNAKKIVNGSLSQMENSFINWAKTGKLTFSSVFGFMAEEYLRQLFRMQAGSLMTSGISLSGMLGAVGSFFGFGATTAAIPLASGTNYVPYDGFAATLHKGEAVVPAAYNPAAGGSGAGGSLSIGAGQVINIGQGVSRAEVFSAVSQANAQNRASIMRTLKQQGVTA